jgi:hypothetical protein
LPIKMASARSSSTSAQMKLNGSRLKQLSRARQALP